MPDTDLTLHDPQTTFLPSEHVATRVWKLAERIARTEFVPGSLRGKPEAILAAMLTGREIGIGAMHSLRAIDVIDGRPSLSPELLHALALREGHDLDVEEATRAGATVAVRRHDWPAGRVRRITFDEVDARLAGLVGQECKPADGVHPNTTTTRSGNPTCGCKQGYRTYPRAMYRARAIAEACRSYLPDVVERIGYTAEEFGGENPAHGDAVETVREALGDEAAERAAEQLADDEILEAEVVDEAGEHTHRQTGRATVTHEHGGPFVHDHDDDPDGDDGGTPPEDEPEPDAPAPSEAPILEVEEVVEDDAHEANDVAPPAEPAAEVCRHTVRDTIDTRGGWRCRRCGTAAEATEPEHTPPRPDVATVLEGSIPEIVATVAREGLDAGEVWAAEVARAEEQGRDPRVTLRRSLGVEDRPSRPETPAEGKDTGGTTPAPQEAAAHVPDGMDPAEVEYRRTVLKRYRTLYRETYEIDQQAAARMHALRLEAVGASDGAILWVERREVERLLEEASKIHGSVVPF